MDKLVDVLIIGSGIAGQRAALEAILHSDKVTILSKLPVMDSHSIAATGGINSAFSTTDSNFDHFADTIKGSDYLADQDAVHKLVDGSNDEIFFLEQIGVNFDKNDDLFVSAKLGGAKFARSLNSSNEIGLVIMNKLSKAIDNSNVSVLENWQVLDLIVKDNRCFGVIALNTNTFELCEFRSHATILATGPAGFLYRNTTNSNVCTGDGFAFAYRAGALLKDMEFIQFHPTSILGSNVLVTERSRSVGAKLFNNRGERFMKKYAPDNFELAPRDIVTRSIINEINNGFGFYDNQYGNYVELSFLDIDTDVIDEKLSDVKKLALSSSNIDICNSPLKVIPAQHYMMGGIMINIDCQTSIDGLYAAGECSCSSVHGANRLGGNSLIECLVFGKIAGNRASNYNATNNSFISDMFSSYSLLVKNLLENDKSPNIDSISNKLRTLMTSNVGICRDKQSLNEAINTIQSLKHKFDDSSIYKISNIDICNYFELLNMLDISEIIAVSSLTREESRGSHYRLDFPLRDDDRWLKHILINKSINGPNISIEKVVINDLEPASRKY